MVRGRLRNVPGHRYVGYTEHGDYRCECGLVIWSPGKPLQAGTVAADCVRDQWHAHKNEVVLERQAAAEQALGMYDDGRWDDDPSPYDGTYSED